MNMTLKSMPRFSVGRLAAPIILLTLLSRSVLSAQDQVLYVTQLTAGSPSVAAYDLNTLQPVDVGTALTASRAVGNGHFYGGLGTDSSGNVYLTFAAMLMAGLDGIRNKIHPGDAMDKNLYDLPPEELKDIPTVCHSLDMALDYLDKDRAFLKAGGVFTDDVIDSYIELKMAEVTRIRMTTHPVEFDMYYSM